MWVCERNSLMWSIDLMEKVVNRTPVCDHLHYYWTMFPFNNVNNIRLLKKKAHENLLKSRKRFMTLLIYISLQGMMVRSNAIKMQCYSLACIHFLIFFLFRLNHLLFNSSDYLIQSSKILSTLLIFFFFIIHLISFADNLLHRIHAPTPIISLISIRNPYMVSSSFKYNIYLMHF